MEKWEFVSLCVLFVTVFFWIKVTDYQLDCLDKKYDQLQLRVEALESKVKLLEQRGIINGRNN